MSTQWPEVTERDLRDPRLKHGEPSEYEFRADGAIVHKDRWEKAIHAIRQVVMGRSRGDFEIADVVAAVESCIDALAPKPWPDDEEGEE